MSAKVSVCDEKIDAFADKCQDVCQSVCLRWKNRRTRRQIAQMSAKASVCEEKTDALADKLNVGICGVPAAPPQATWRSLSNALPRLSPPASLLSTSCLLLPLSCLPPAHLLPTTCPLLSPPASLLSTSCPLLPLVFVFSGKYGRINQRKVRVRKKQRNWRGWAPG